MSGGHPVSPVCSDLKVCDIGGWESAPLLDRSAPRNTTAFRRRPPRGCLRWLLLRPLPGGHTHALRLSRWCPWDPGGCTHVRTSCGWCPLFVKGSKIERPSPFQVKSNKPSRDVKGLRCEVCVASSHRYKLVRLQLEDELHVQVGYSVRVRHGPGLAV
jgi:hypothetical protein